MKSISNRSTSVVAFILILGEIIAVILPVVFLGKYFEFPGILREPAQKGLSLFK
jgi:hypothetical protein